MGANEAIARRRSNARRRSSPCGTGSWMSSRRLLRYGVVLNCWLSKAATCGAAENMSVSSLLEIHKNSDPKLPPVGAHYGCSRNTWAHVRSPCGLKRLFTGGKCAIPNKFHFASSCQIHTGHLGPAKRCTLRRHSTLPYSGTQHRPQPEHVIELGTFQPSGCRWTVGSSALLRQP